jgi:hypothetical protein
MALKGRLSRTLINLSFLALDISLFSNLLFPSTQGTVGHALRETRRADVSKTAAIDASAILSGVHIGDNLSFPIVQQPQGNSNYVSNRDGEVTQFSTVSQYGNIGLLAHNYLSGRSFAQLVIGQEVRLVYDDGRTEYFVVQEILRYQALDPKSPYSSFKNMNNEAEILSAGEMFDRAYAGERHITFQTCIKAEGDASWGRMFILATPKPLHLGVGGAALQRLP